MFLYKSKKDKDLVLFRVAKHGSHDQKTHGRKGGGGGGGGGGGSSESAQSGQQTKDANKLAEELSGKELDSVITNMNDLKDEAFENYSKKEMKLMSQAQDAFIGARKDFKDAKKLTGKKQTDKLQSGVKKLESGMGALGQSDIKEASYLAQGIYDDLVSGNLDSMEALGLDVYNP